MTTGRDGSEQESGLSEGAPHYHGRRQRLRARLKEIKGVGETVVDELKIVQAAASRLARAEVRKRPLLSSWSSVLDYWRMAQAFADKEQFRVLFLDKRNKLIADGLQQTGTVDHTRSIRARWSSARSNCRPPR